MFNDVLLIPDLFDWITGRWAQELVNLLDGYRTLTCPSWFLGRHPHVFRTLARHSRMIVNIDPWFAPSCLDCCRELPQQKPLACVLHHVNKDDSRAGFIAQADLPVAACEAAQEHLAGLVKLPRQVLLVENGVDLEEFHPRNKAESRRAFGMDERAVVIGYVGCPSSDSGGRKGLDTLQKVVSALASDKEIEFAFCGASKAAWDDCPTGVEGRIRHFGFIKRKRLGSFYNALDALLMTSRNEGGPAPVLEAMACGVPAVASRTGIVPKVVVTGENGYCLDPNDVSSFIETLRRLAADRKLCNSLGKRARATIEDGWGWQEKMAPFARAIDATLKSAGGDAPRLDLARPLRVVLERYVRTLERMR